MSICKRKPKEEEEDLLPLCHWLSLKRITWWQLVGFVYPDFMLIVFCYCYGVFFFWLPWFWHANCPAIMNSAEQENITLIIPFYCKKVICLCIQIFTFFYCRFLKFTELFVLWLISSCSQLCDYSIKGDLGQSVL